MKLPENAMSVEVAVQPSRTTAALHDLISGTLKSWMWSAMAQQDIRLRYRGSILGPFWLTLSTIIMISAMGIIYARLFNMEIVHYLPFLTVGLVLWTFLSSVINEGCQTFLSAQNVIQQVPMPFSVHVWRTVYRNLLVLAHSLVIVPFVLVIFGVSIHWDVVWIIPAFVLVTINSAWICLLLGMLSARYRDVPPIVASIVQIIFFVTPIFWPPDAVGRWKQFMPLNPLFAAIDVIRAPLLGQEPQAYSWLSLIVVTVVGTLVTLFIFVKFRPRIAYWI
jgi:ABC-type polysaccharide/polyol phosphate export permease